MSNEFLEQLESMKELQEEKENNVVELNSWKINFICSATSELPISDSIFNVELILQNDNLLLGKIAFNEFTNEEELKDDIVLNGIKISKGALEDSFTHALKSYIEQEYDFLPKTQHVHSAVANISRKNSYHPLKLFLEEAKEKWDGKPRIESLLQHTLGVENSEYTKKAFTSMLMGAIQKVYHPYEKFDFVYDFVGDQGTGKTSLLSKLFLENKGFYTDSINTFRDKDDIGVMMRCWLVNDDEMVVSKKAKIAELKKFASQKELEYRPPYARSSIRRPKTFLLVRTTNEFGHLVDKLGNRRFIPFRSNAEKRVQHPLDFFNHNIVMQVWGEAMAKFEEINRQDLYREVEKLAEEERQQFESVDSVEEVVLAVLEVPVPPDFYDYNDVQRASYVQGYLSNNHTRFTIGNKTVSIDDLVPRDKVRIKDLSLEGFDEPLGKNNKRDRKIRLVMDSNPNWVKSSRNGIRFGNVKATGYMRKNSRQADG